MPIFYCVSSFFKNTPVNKFLWVKKIWREEFWSGEVKKEHWSQICLALIEMYMCITQIFLTRHPPERSQNMTGQRGRVLQAIPPHGNYTLRCENSVHSSVLISNSQNMSCFPLWKKKCFGKYATYENSIMRLEW